jgi:hypothetical protein
MAIYVYKCGNCNHKLELGDCNCEKCAEPTPMINRHYVLGTIFFLAINFIVLTALF